MERFLLLALQSLSVVPVPEQAVADEGAIRDVKDQPIMRAALAAKVDVILTGDRDFLESGIRQPRILTAKQFLSLGDDLL